MHPRLRALCREVADAAMAVLLHGGMTPQDAAARLVAVLADALLAEAWDAAVWWVGPLPESLDAKIRRLEEEVRRLREEMP